MPEPKPPAAPAAASGSGSVGPGVAPNGAGEGSATASPAPIPAELELRVQASRATEVSIAADGKNVFQGRMSRGESRVFKASDHFDVSAKNSFALVLELNGVSMPPMGQPDSPGSVTLSRKDLAPPRGSGGENH